MKRIILCLSLFAFFGSQAQQINPVPDYVFSNKMSVGRNAVTDTAAYFSIGPRYGAIRGMMPPMVTDTANMSATKRNGLLIFSIQKNKYLYWDSVGSKWAEMAGTAGSAITGSGVAGYMPEFTTATNIDTTRLYHSNGRFAIGTTSPISFFDIIGTKAPGGGEQEGIRIIGSIAARQGISFGYDSTSADQYAIIQSHTGSERTTINYQAEKHKFTYGQVENAALYIDSIGRVGINNSASSYNLDVTGNLRTTTSAIIASSSGNLSVGTTEIGAKVDIRDANSDLLRVARTSAGNMLVQYINATTTDDIIHRFRLNNGSGNFYDLRYYGTGGYFGLQYNGANGLHLNTSSEVLINTNLDAGAYALQVAGSIYNTTGAVFAASSGDVFIGGTSDAYSDAGRKVLSINGTSNSLFSMRSGGTSIGFLYSNGTTSFDIVSNGKPITFNTSSALTEERIRIHSNGGLKFVGQADPPQPEAGTVYYDTDDNKLKVYNGTTWVDLH